MKTKFLYALSVIALLVLAAYPSFAYATGTGSCRFSPFPPPPLTVTVTPATSTIIQGHVQKLTAAGCHGTPPYTYTWYNDTTGTPVLITGATNSTFYVYGGALGTFKYYAVAKDLVNGTARSNNATVVVKS